MTTVELTLAVTIGAGAVGFAIGMVRELVRDRRWEARREAVWRELAERDRAAGRLSELGQRERRP